MEIEETKPLITEDQFRVSTKIVRDISRYERKRRIAARMIADFRRQNVRLFAENYEQKQYIQSLEETVQDLNEKNHDLEARLSDEMEAHAETNEQWFEKSGEVAALKWAFEHK